jgi:hypothetical protein
MHTVNTLVICKDDYETEEMFFNAIKDAIKVLLDNNYISVIDWDEKGLGILRIDYASSDRTLGDYYPIWLSPKEEDYVMLMDDSEHDNNI